jgi:hypothetical protein
MEKIKSLRKRTARVPKAQTCNGFGKLMFPASDRNLRRNKLKF